ncbi:MAG: endoribonuclease MazF [Betaproteobacteria bacterium]|nr:endoribonuclease MazF [Betaproteobacteria bacterium]
MVAKFVPERGDIVWLDFNPQAGHEQSGRRPALVLSTKGYNGKTNLAVVCPITNKVKGYPFEVLLPEGPVTGAVLSDQVASLDWVVRRAVRVAAVGDDILGEVLAKIVALIQL